MDAGGSGSRWTLVLVSLASLGWAVSFGLGAPLAALWLEEAGQNARMIGLNTSLYYLGVAVASPLVPRLMRQGNRACVVVGMLTDAVTTVLFPWCDSVLAWHTLRLLGGVGTAFSLIPMETLVNHNALPERRARDFAFYAFCVAVGIGLGGSVIGLPVYATAPRLAFALGGLVTLLAITLAWLVLPWRVLVKEEAADHEAFVWRDGALGLGTAWAQGFLEGGTFAFLSLYLLSLDFAEAIASGLMGALFAGVALAQLPLGWLADRVGRFGILLLCHALVLTGLLLVPWFQGAVILTLLLFLLGACCGALYPLGLALLGDRVPAGGMARANAWYLASNCAGSLTGPVVIGLAIDGHGLRAQFVVGASAIVLVLVLASLVTRRPGSLSSPSSCRRAA